MKHIGFFEKTGKGQRLVEARVEEDSCVILYWIISEENGVIVDAKFQVFGPPELIEAAERTCEYVIGKNYDQATRIKEEKLIMSAVQEAALQCRDIALKETYVGKLMTKTSQEESECYPDWEELSFPQKMALFEEVFDKEIRPFIKMDGGDVEISNFIADEKKLIIIYHGACAHCFSALGSTLSYIQHIVSTKICPDIVVEPEL